MLLVLTNMTAICVCAFFLCMLQCFRYANEELRVTASAIAVAVIGAMGGGRGRVAELGACMADLIASDFENLELAGLRYG